MTDYAKHYIDVLNEIGDVTIEEINNIGNKYIADNAVKIINGEQACTSGKDVIVQLTEVRSVAGKCQFTLLNNLKANTEKACALRYQLDSEKAGNFQTIAIVRFNDDMQIIEIDEIYTVLDS